MKRLIIAIALILLIVPLDFLSLHPATALADRIKTETRSPLDAEFKQLVDSSYAAWNELNADAVAEFYAKDEDLVVYDAIPLKYRGWTAFKAGIQKNLFDKMINFKLSANDDFHATRQGNLVWATFTYHLSARLKDGKTIEAEGRQTDLWEQRNGLWQIVHEHTSVPASL